MFLFITTSIVFEFNQCHHTPYRSYKFPPKKPPIVENKNFYRQHPDRRIEEGGLFICLASSKQDYSR